MSNRVLRGFWRYMLPIPQNLWRKRIAKVEKKIEAELGFMSEEHAREYRRKVHRLAGSYFTLEQIVYITPIIQSVIFAF